MQNQNVEQYVLSRILLNTIKGCFYAFIPTDDIQDGLAELDANPNFVVHSFGEYLIVEVNPPYAINKINETQPNTFYKGDLDVITDEIADSVVEFEKFLVKRGVSNENFKATIAIYSTNKTPMIMYNNTNYPAFRLNLLKTLQILKGMGYQIKLGNAFVPIDIALSNKADLLRSMKLSPVRNGVFLNIQCALSSEQMKQKEIELKQKYS